MKQQPFEQKYRAVWDELARMAADKTPDPRLPAVYRKTCHHLAIARSRHYSAALCQRLNDLVMRGHQRLYTQNQPWRRALGALMLRELPRVLAVNRQLIWLSLALFFLPMLVTGYACYSQDDLILSFLGPEQVANFQAMYDPEGEHQGSVRTSGDDWLMFGFYIKNNIGIGFQTFAGGMFAGLGSIFIVLFNGLMIGAVAGHLTQVGFAETFYPFVIGHGAFELTAIALAGAAGLRLGYTLVNPRGYRRLDALRMAGREAIVLIYAVIVMLLTAAFLEAFWSSSQVVPGAVKYAVGSVFWMAVIGYLAVCTRRPKARHGA